ncbi:MAG: hypothetical protein ABIB93_07670 [Chloroflexota bacterium]
MNPEEDILVEIKKFFGDIFEIRNKTEDYAYASYKIEWLEGLGLSPSSSDESKTSKTTKKLQQHLKEIFGSRIKTEAPVAEGMTLRFAAENGESDTIHIDSNKLQAFDVLDFDTGTAFEISLSDAFSEFFKDVLKALLDSRVKKLYLCMRNHNYRGAKKSGYLKVKDSPMVAQYISLAKLYKLDIFLVDLFPSCNEKQPANCEDTLQ